MDIRTKKVKEWSCEPAFHVNLPPIFIRFHRGLGSKSQYLKVLLWCEYIKIPRYCPEIWCYAPFYKMCICRDRHTVMLDSSHINWIMLCRKYLVIVSSHSSCALFSHLPTLWMPNLFPMTSYTSCKIPTECLSVNKSELKNQVKKFTVIVKHVPVVFMYLSVPPREL